MAATNRQPTRGPTGGPAPAPSTRLQHLLLKGGGSYVQHCPGGDCLSTAGSGVPLLQRCCEARAQGHRRSCCGTAGRRQPLPGGGAQGRLHSCHGALAGGAENVEGGGVDSAAAGWRAAAPCEPTAQAVSDANAEVLNELCDKPCDGLRLEGTCCDRAVALPRATALRTSCRTH